MNSNLFIRSVHVIKELLLIVVCLFIIGTKASSQIQPDQIGFPPNSTQLWLLGIDTLNTSPTYGLGRWYNFAQLIDSIASTGIWDHDWYEEGTTSPPNAITDDMFHTGNVGINNIAPDAKLDIISSDATPALIIKGSTSYPNLFQFLKPNGTNLLRGQWDGGNFHHYVDGNIYYNLNGHQVLYDGNATSNSGLRVSGGASLLLDDTPITGFGLIWAGPYSYATSGTPLTSIYPLQISTWGWNGSDGSTIHSITYFKQTQLSTSAGDARFDILNHSNSSVFSILTASGNIGVGTISPSAKFHIMSSTEQIRTGYDASNYFATTVSSAGLTTFDGVGSGAGFLFADKLGYTTNGSTATTIAGRDGTYFSDITLGTGLSLSSGTLNIVGASANIKINNLQTADGTNTIDNAAYQQEWQWNYLVGGTGLKLSSTSHDANGSTQKLFEVALSGSNTNSNELTYAGYFSNFHDGSSPTNFGVYGTVANGSSASAGVKGEATSNVGVRGMSTSNVGVFGSSSTSTGIQGTTTGGGVGVVASSTTASGLPLSVTDIAGGTNTVEIMVDYSHSVTGTPSSGVGVSSTYTVQTTSASQIANTIISKWIDPTDATRTSNFIIQGVNNAVTSDRFIIGGDSTRVNGTLRASQMRTQWAQSSSSSVTLTLTSVNGLAMSASGTPTVALPDATASTIGYWFNIANVGSGTVHVSAPGSSDQLSGDPMGIGYVELFPGESGIWECAANNYWIKN